MGTIHISVTRLYQAAKERRDVTGQSAVARLLGVSPQVVKNWEDRGLSEKGALQAQNIVGCNANWLLGESEQPTLRTWPAPIENHHTVSEPIAEYLAGWPFSKVTKEQFNQLSEEQKAHIETSVLMLLSTKKETENKHWPESYSAAA